MQARPLRRPLSSLRGPFLGAALAAACLLPGVVGRASAQGIPGYVVLPLSPMQLANQATLRVTMNGKSTMLVLDTGAPLTLLDNGFYQGARSQATTVNKADLPPGMQQHVTANGQAAEVGYIDGLKAGAMDFGKSPVVVTDLSATLGSYNHYHAQSAIGGLLGEDVLHRYSAIIDWRRHGVYFNTDPSKRLKLGPGLIASGWTAVPMEPASSQHFLVPCTVAGKPVRLIVDTGAEFTTFIPGIVPLNIIYNRDTGTSMARLASTGTALSMIGGDSMMHPARVTHWQVGNFEVDSSSVAVGSIPRGLLNLQAKGDGPILGLLGAEFLAKNNAILDIGGSTLYLKAKQ